jgi:hypothetical protein
MIVREFYMTRGDGVNLYRTYSDADFLIQKVGTEEFYGEAIDVEGAPYEYVETDKPNEYIEEENITSEEFDNMLKEVL